MDIKNDAIEIFDGTLSRSEIENMSYKQLLIELEHRGRFIRENAEEIKNKKAAKQLGGMF